MTFQYSVTSQHIAYKPLRAFGFLRVPSLWMCLRVSIHMIFVYSDVITTGMIATNFFARMPTSYVHIIQVPSIELFIATIFLTDNRFFWHVMNHSLVILTFSHCLKTLIASCAYVLQDRWMFIIEVSFQVFLVFEYVFASLTTWSVSTLVCNQTILSFVFSSAFFY